GAGGAVRVGTHLSLQPAGDVRLRVAAAQPQGHVEVGDVRGEGALARPGRRGDPTYRGRLPLPAGQGARRGGGLRGVPQVPRVGDGRLPRLAEPAAGARAVGRAALGGVVRGVAAERRGVGGAGAAVRQQRQDRRGPPGAGAGVLLHAGGGGAV